MKVLLIVLFIFETSKAQYFAPDQSIDNESYHASYKALVTEKEDDLDDIDDPTSGVDFHKPKKFKKKLPLKKLKKSDEQFWDNADRLISQSPSK